MFIDPTECDIDDGGDNILDEEDDEDEDDAAPAPMEAPAGFTIVLDAPQDAWERTSVIVEPTVGLDSVVMVPSDSTFWVSGRILFVLRILFLESRPVRLFLEQADSISVPEK